MTRSGWTCCGSDAVFAPIDSEHFVFLRTEIRGQHFSHIRVVFDDEDFRLCVCHARPFDQEIGSFWMMNSQTPSPIATHLDSFTRNSLPPETHLRLSCNKPVAMKQTGLSAP
jgi:hypothetical protein